MDYDDVTMRTTRVASDAESDALDAALDLVKIELRVESHTYKLLKQLAEYNGISLQHMMRVIIEQRLKV